MLKQLFRVPDLILIALLASFGTIFQSDEYRLIGLSFIAILYIVFGEDIDRKLSNKKDRKEGSREWVASFILGIVLYGLGSLSLSSLGEIIADKWDIIGLILSFALMSYGIGESGFFRYSAYKITESCGGNTARLTLYLFVLTSVLTLVTSNDIVILVLTPIILQVAYYSRIKNARLMLLSQFVAANTLSMGLIIGSPTNIIFGTALDYNFLSYIWLMIIPTVITFMVSLIVVDVINNRKKSDDKKQWHFLEKYTLPKIEHKQNYSQEMKL